MCRIGKNKMINKRKEYKTHIQELMITPRLYNKLARNNIFYVEQLTKYSDLELAYLCVKIKMCEKNFYELRDALKYNGFKLKNE